MNAFRDLHAFLAALRRRLVGLAAGRLVLGVLALALVLLAAWPLVAAGAAPGLLASLRTAGAVGLLVLAAALALAVALPARRYRHDRELARHVARRVPDVGSDLRSSLELEAELTARLGEPRFSPELAIALAESTAARVAMLDLRELAPAAPLRRMGKVTLVATLVHLALLVALPGRFATGWGRLVGSAAPAAVDATAVHEPLVGDLKLTLTFPAYMRREPLVIPASSGDVVAPAGTRIAIETTALRPAVRARIIFDGQPPEDGIALQVDGRTLRGELTVKAAATFRFLLEPPTGRAVVEGIAHRLEIEPDRVPRVELVAPAEELEVSSQRRIELAYDVEDDHGLAELALVYRGASGKDERKIVGTLDRKQRTAAGTYVWDLSEVTLEPGARIAYRLEAKDNDDVGGPNVGSSRTFYLKVYSPAERHQKVLERHEAVLELAVTLLADRIELGARDEATARAIGRTAQNLVAEVADLGKLVADDPLAAKGLKAELEAMHVRLDKLGREEHDALTDLERGGRGALARLGDLGGKNVTELERDVLLLDDWLERQRVEEMLQIMDEMEKHRDKLKQLLDDFARTKDPALRAEIEREIRALEKRMAELQKRLAELGGETEDRFVNPDALAQRDTQDCLQKVRELVAKGDAAGAQAELERCTRIMDEQAQALEGSLRGLRQDKFSPEEKAFGELQNELADLAKAQDDVAARADELHEAYKEKAAEAARERNRELEARARKTLDRLKDEARGIPKGGLTSFAQEERDHLLKRLDDVAKMLEDGDVAEALQMARQAEDSLRTIDADLDDDLADGEPASERTGEAIDQVERARPLARQLVDELEAAMPKAEDIMSAEDRRQLDQLRRRQQQIRDRAGKLAQKAQKKAGELPGRAAEAAQEGLAEAQQHMERAARDLGRRNPLGARDEARAAADKMRSMRKSVERAARPSSGEGGRGVDDDEPVRIPGAQEFKPSEEFREKILDAKKKGTAPEAYEGQVQRYYEELVK